MAQEALRDVEVNESRGPQGGTVLDNRQGERTEKKDQNETVHTYGYDRLGRLIEDEASQLGDNIDETVRRIATSYEVRGMVQRITSYGALSGEDGGSSSSSSAGATAINEVFLEYNDFGQLTADYQEHDGEVNVLTTPKVEYAYSDATAGHARLTKITYPNGRGLLYGYASGADDALNRVSYLADESGSTAGVHLVEYSYLGLGTFVQADYTEPDLRYDLAHGSGDDPYTGLDRFDRVVDLLWRNYAASTDAVRIRHGYDRAGNRLWREDPVAAANGVNLDELYSYDGMFQLTDRERGDLNANHSAVTTKNFAEAWTLDMTGNWPSFRQDTDGDGTWDLDQSRTHDAANEITAIAGSASHIAHDRAGNMTRIPKPDDWSAHFDLTYDVWNRLVKVMDGETSVATCGYDGRNYRVTQLHDGVARHFYYSSEWQLLEERRSTAVPRSPIPVSQYVWGLRYVDDLVLRDRDADNSPSTGSFGLASSGLEERLYALQDPNWNVVAVANVASIIQERYTFGAYGEPTFLTGLFGSRGTSQYEWQMLYTGQKHDSMTSLYHYRNRDYHPCLGQFISRDPISYKGGINLYEYAGDSPFTWTDPTGESPIVLACVGACGATAACLGPGIYYCGDAALKGQAGFWDCMKIYWDLLPTWEKWVCGVATAGCIACLFRLALQLIKRNKCAALKLTKEGACTAAQGAGNCTSKRGATCKCGYSSKGFAAIAGLWSACSAARAAYTYTCFKPGTPGWDGHVQQIKETAAAATKCMACAAQAAAKGN